MLQKDLWKMAERRKLEFIGRFKRQHSDTKIRVLFYLSLIPGTKTTIQVCRTYQVDDGNPVDMVYNEIAENSIKYESTNQ